MPETLQKTDVKKYGLGIVFDWTGADLVNRTFGRDEEYLFTIPADTVQEEPIAISIAQKEVNSRVRIRVDVGANSRVSFAQKVVTREYCELEVDVRVAEGAKAEYAIIQTTHDSGYSASTYRGRVENNASLTWFDIELGGKIISVDIETNLVGHGAIGNTYGLFSGSGEQAFDIRHHTNHMAARTTSLMESKGVLDNAAKAVYRGLIHISKDMPGCNGYERCDTLLLSKQAQTSNIPELEIGSSDVKCGHASTISRIDMEKLFYFGSRGISADDAVRECALGHAMVIVDKIQNSKTRERIRDLVLKI